MNRKENKILTGVLLGASVFFAPLLLVLGFAWWVSLPGSIFIAVCIRGAQARSAFHAMAFCILLVQLLGLCDSCAGLGADAYLFGVSLAGLGLLGHGGAFFTSLITFVGQKLKLVSLLFSAFVAAASPVYTVVLLQGSGWCDACLAIHLAMAFLILNQIFKAQSEVQSKEQENMNQNDPTLEKVFTAVPHFRAAICYSAAFFCGVIILVACRSVQPDQSQYDSLSTLEENSSEINGSDASNTSKQEKEGAYFSWGNDVAPYRLELYLNPTCEHCQKFIQGLGFFQDRIDKQDLQIRFLLAYDSPISQAAVSFIYAAIANEEKQSFVFSVFFKSFQTAMQIKEAADFLKDLDLEENEKDRLLVALKNRRNEVDGYIKSAAQRSLDLGGRGTPRAWLVESATDAAVQRWQRKDVSLDKILAALE